MANDAQLLQVRRASEVRLDDCLNG